MALRQSSLLALPGELRNRIYCDYLFIGAEDGYIYDYEAGKLRTADMQPIDLNLMYTCRLIAAEMRGLALRLHTITFSTVFSEQLRPIASLWDEVFVGHYLSSDLDEYVPLMKDEMAEEVRRRYGQTHFYTTFCRMRAEGIARDVHYDHLHQAICGFGEPPSVFRDIACDVLQLASTDPAIHAAMMNWETKEFRRKWNPSVWYSTLRAPWKFPTGPELARIVDQGASSTIKRWDINLHADDVGMYRVSAASAAIRFLSSVPGARQHLRKIVLHEDHVAAAHPECHVRGLVPFCHENPALRIERRVSLWRNLFLLCRDSEINTAYEVLFGDACERLFPLLADTITRRVAMWMVEAALPEIPDAITLVLDGDPIPERTALIFDEVVQRDAAWQTALDRTFTPEAGAHPHDVFYKRGVPPFQFVGFPELLRDLSERRQGGRISCNFDPGRTWDEGRVAAVAEANGGRDRDVTAWTQAWEREGEGYETAPPLPPFHRLLEDLVKPGTTLESLEA
ncbi:hypothetical protein CONLIGDRAFT_647502 [Coniochaeta ligniaria NRRL 30616]|uniref:Uncharacterized protein n=1 Tax=Coniochaeta ligniaria NRRL 30616 TaxID=1408157 RepID=A0A1J7IE72_9PEZI|nr:hypothetical protein CONLIGDRAFT_647502 [Coniochaeta ligniaria NRRL 30616]